MRIRNCWLPGLGRVISELSRALALMAGMDCADERVAVKKKKTLESPDDSSVENVERLRGNGLHFVELAGKRKQALVRQGGKPLTCG